MAGMIDMYEHTGNRQALDIAVRMQIGPMLTRDPFPTTNGRRFCWSNMEA